MRPRSRSPVPVQRRRGKMQRSARRVCARRIQARVGGRRRTAVLANGRTADRHNSIVSSASPALGSLCSLLCRAPRALAGCLATCRAPPVCLAKKVLLGQLVPAARVDSSQLRLVISKSNSDLKYFSPAPYVYNHLLLYQLLVN